MLGNSRMRERALENLTLELFPAESVGNRKYECFGRACRACFLSKENVVCNHCKKGEMSVDTPTDSERGSTTKTATARGIFN